MADMKTGDTSIMKIEVSFREDGGEWVELPISAFLLDEDEVPGDEQTETPPAEQSDDDGWGVVTGTVIFAPTPLCIELPVEFRAQTKEEKIALLDLQHWGEGDYGDH